MSDLVDFVELILSHQKTSFELINIGSGVGISIASLVKKVIKASGKNIKIEYDRSKPTIKFSLSLNLGKAKEVYNWKPKVSLDEGIRKTLAWYTKNIS